MAEDSFLQAINGIEVAVGVKAGFLIALMKEDDWSFVIKIHALVEAAITHLLVIGSDNKKLENIYGLLELSDSQKGKLAFVRELNLLKREHRNLIKMLSGIRNTLAHNIKNVDMTLDQYIKQFDKQQLKSFVDAVMIDFDFDMEINGDYIPIREIIKDNPKFGIWIAVMNLFGIIYIQKENLILKKSYLEKAEIIAKIVTGYKPLNSNADKDVKSE